MPSSLKGIHMAVALNTGNFPTSILYASGDSLFIGRIEQLQKLDIQTLRVGEETPRRICHSKEMKSYGVGFLKDTLDEAGSVSRSSNFKVLDEDAFEGECCIYSSRMCIARHVHRLIVSVTTCSFFPI